MKIKTINTNSRFLCVFNIVVCMRKHILNIMLSTVLLSVFTIGHSYAGVWKDLFDDAALNGWERIVEDDPWFASWELDDLAPGILFAIIEKPKQEDVTAADFLHWNAHQFQLDRLTVVGEEMRYPRHAPDISGELCLFLGKRLPAPDFAAGYIFSPEKTTEMQFTANGVYKKGEVKADYSLMFRLTSGNLKVVFRNGKFRLFTQELLITEFFDDEIPMIDVVGLMVVHKFPGKWFDSSISTFSISGQGIPNHNSLDVQLQGTQLTTTWGELKRF